MEDKGNISDGYHTFNELYEHRHLLFISLMVEMPIISWIADKHGDGTMYDEWFVAGMNLMSGQITYHLPNRIKYLFDNTKVKKLEFAPAYDGHTSDDVLKRLKLFINQHQIYGNS